MQQITVLGSTGSIGKNTLDVLERHTDQFAVFALTAAKQVDLLLTQVQRFKPMFAVMTDEAAARLLAGRVQAEGLPTVVLSGPEALVKVASDERVDQVMAAIVGAAGLPPCMAAARAGKRILLANKEALVVGGRCFMDAVRHGEATLLPIDSEHSAVFQSLPEDSSTWKRRIQKIVLTASGGPFRTRPLETFSSIQPDEACAHPNWVMGRKISVDSATMMNKALEVIEAYHLFDVEPSQIEVIIHPQSVIHSMVQYRDGSVVAQLGTPDMRVPIAYGLAWPERVVSGSEAIDFQRLGALTFEAPEPTRFPGLQLAWQVLEAPLGTPAVLNAANEMAVDAFLNKRIRFDHIHAVNQRVLECLVPHQANNLETLLALDAEARAKANEVIEALTL